jgi:hypothetical protein
VKEAVLFELQGREHLRMGDGDDGDDDDKIDELMIAEGVGR